MANAGVRAVQRLLNDAGHSPGDIDGIWGPKTEAALRDALSGPQDAPDELDANDRLLIRELERDEGRVLHAYQDHLGWWTIGIGRLIDKRKGGGITSEEADYLKLNDVRKVKAQLDDRLPWWRDLDPVRQRAIQNMAFQLGIGGLLGFRNTLAKIRAGDYDGAAANMAASLWAKQTPDRARRVMAMIRNGTV